MNIKTRNAYVATRILDTPFWGLYNLLPVILYKDLGFSPFQLALLTAIKPLVSILSSYWSSRVENRPDRLVPSIMWGRGVAFLPFFLFPFVDDPAFFIAAYGVFMMMATANMPAWIELLKTGIPERTREKVFLYTQAFGYMGGGLIPIIWGYLLDHHPSSWRFLFPLASILGLTSFFFQRKIITSRLKEPEIKHNPHWLRAPWEKMGAKLKENKSFKYFQMGFMLLGGGLMIIQPALPLFFVDYLEISYLDLGIAITLCKGLGFAISSPFWSSWMPKTSLFVLCGRISLIGICFLALLLSSTSYFGLLFAAYLVYGVLQSGSELVWNLSGPVFAGDKDSSLYSSVSVVAVGLRGCFIPAVGAYLASFSTLTPVFGASFFLFLTASFLFYSFRKQVLVDEALDKPQPV